MGQRAAACPQCGYDFTPDYGVTTHKPARMTRWVVLGSVVAVAILIAVVWYPGVAIVIGLVLWVLYKVLHAFWKVFRLWEFLRENN
jgi:hypothetical protein